MLDLWELLVHLAGGRPIRKHIVGGSLELLILLAVAIGLVRYFRPHFFHRFWDHVRRVSGRRLLGVSLSLGILAILLSDSAFKFGHPLTALIFFLVLSSAIITFIWAILRLLDVLTPNAPPANRPLWDKYQRCQHRVRHHFSRARNILAQRLPPSIRSRHVAAAAAYVLLWLPLLALAIMLLEVMSKSGSALEKAFLFSLVFPLLLILCVPSLFLLGSGISYIFWKWTSTVRLTPCPSLDHLKDLLMEGLPRDEQARLAAHLEVCTACQYRVEGLTAGQKSWPGMARKLSASSPLPEPALRKVMDRLKENEAKAIGAEPSFCGDLPLGFLSPTDKAGHLGRLDRYEVLEEIGRGGMGVVLKAFDPSLHRVVAIKVLAPQLATSGVARKRFLREAKAAAAVNHDHLVTIHAVDEANGLPYLVMQYVAGQSLQQRIDKDGPLELTDILRIGMQTASGLAAAHAHGIVHRDIKPANILLEEGIQRVKITDFGLARAMDDASLTQSGFVAGSPLYMAPEQARGEGLDHRADLFSLGSVLYTMCTGRPPFRAANTLAVLRRVSEDPPRPIRETNPEIPDWLADLVMKLMAKEPAERFQSAAEVEEILGRRLAEIQHRAWVPPARSPAPAAATDLPTSVTLCPSCGASLQVPERMVGSIVHCFECGKPFHVEEGSEVIQVARPARWPPRPRFGRDRRPRGCIAIAAGCVALMVLLLISYLIVRRKPSMPPRPPVPFTARNPHSVPLKIKQKKEAQPTASPVPKISPQNRK